MAHIDPFLHIWDERFHALVARNMMDHPFVPTLRTNPVLPVDPTSWTQGHIWLHKQPLFMWQMALSMKIFGISEYAIRYPSVITGTLMIPMVYQCCNILSRDKKVSLITAALLCFSCFQLELIGGMRSMDHNDLALEFYLLASVWAFLKYHDTKRWYWIVLIGVFAGAAILVKWLVGLFVFLIWGLKILFKLRNKSTIREVLYFAAALVICGIVFVPWQLYIIHRFPFEAAHEYEFNRRHITEALEGHSGTIFFYLERFPQLFGEGTFLLTFPGIYFYCKSKKKDRALLLPILISVLFVFCFFSFIVKSKVVSHMFFIAPFVFLFMAYSIAIIIGKLKRSYLIIPFLIGVWVLVNKPEKIISDQMKSNEERNRNVHNAEVYKNLKNEMPKGVNILVNVPDCPSVMFYNKGIQAYETFTESEINQLKEQKLPIAVNVSYKRQDIPGYILNYPYRYILNCSIE